MILVFDSELEVLFQMIMILLQNRSSDAQNKIMIGELLHDDLLINF
jgi:hypothetical protein